MDKMLFRMLRDLITALHGFSGGIFCIDAETKQYKLFKRNEDLCFKLIRNHSIFESPLVDISFGPQGDINMFEIPNSELICW